MDTTGKLKSALKSSSSDVTNLAFKVRNIKGKIRMPIRNATFIKPLNDITSNDELMGEDATSCMGTKSFVNVVTASKPNPKLNFRTLFNENKVENTDFVLPVENAMADQNKFANSLVGFFCWKKSDVPIGAELLVETSVTTIVPQEDGFTTVQNRKKKGKKNENTQDEVVTRSEACESSKGTNVNHSFKISTPIDEDSESEVEEVYSEADPNTKGASNDPRERRHLWTDLGFHKTVICGMLWVLLGDFNIALNMEDGLTSSSSINSAMCDFKDCVKHIEVMDINSSVLQYTWNQKPKGKGDPHNEALRDEEAVYLIAFNEANIDEEQFLKQKAKVEWLEVSAIASDNMVRPVTNDEIKTAMFDIGDEKASGLYGYTLAFFKKWRVRLSDLFCYHHHCEELKIINVCFTNDLFLFTHVIPIDIISDIEQLMRGFLWCNGEYKWGRTKVAWADICVLENKGGNPYGFDGFTLINFKEALFRISSLKSLKTQDKLRTWDVGLSSDLNLLRCSLSDAQMDSYEHLFFECAFSSKVWVYVWNLAHMDGVSPTLHDIIAFLQPVGKSRTAKCIFDTNSARVIMEALDEFKLVSRLVPSLPKSTTYFCNVLNHTKLAIFQILPFDEGHLPVKYLGVSDMYRVGLAANSKVSAVFHDGTLIWPQDVIARMEVIKPFSVNEVWKAIRPMDTKVDWSVVVWFSNNIPRHAINLCVKRLLERWKMPTTVRLYGC
nr:RNA-directed DNA polymerase, eukaryota, reverse transcriptase zinc-binding domain protein [Tanacetum cinerariifolium]